jgi:hypothetical protein
VGGELLKAVQPDKLGNPVSGTCSVTSGIDIGWSVEKKHIMRHLTLPGARHVAG